MKPSSKDPFPTAAPWVPGGLDALSHRIASTSPRSVGGEVGRSQTCVNVGRNDQDVLREIFFQEMALIPKHPQLHSYNKAIYSLLGICASLKFKGKSPLLHGFWTQLII